MPNLNLDQFFEPNQFTMPQLVPQQENFPSARFAAENEPLSHKQNDESGSDAHALSFHVSNNNQAEADDLGADDGITNQFFVQPSVNSQPPFQTQSGRDFIDPI